MPVFNTIAERAQTPWPVSIAIGKQIPMHNQGELNRHNQTTCRRIVHRRSAVTAVADVFIQSLVLAGFCPNHHPKRRSRPIHHKTSPTGYRPLPTSTKYTFNKQSPNTSNFGLRGHSFNPRISHIHLKPLSTYAAKSEVDNRDLDRLSSKRANNKTSTGTERVSGDYDDGGTIPQSREAMEISSSNVHTPRKQERRTNVGSPELTLRLTSFRGYQIWVIDYNRWLKTTRRRNNKDGLAIKERFQGPAIAKNLKLLLPAIDDRTKSNQYVFSLYKRLPTPGVRILSVEERAQLLYRFAHPPDRRRSNARYFLILFNDMIEAGFKLSKSVCTSAIYFTAHKVPRLEKRDLMDAIAIWHRMESIYGLEADGVVFELLFRIATLSGHFAVADRLYQEMKKRGLRLSRRGHVTLMYSYGIRCDVEGVHKTFEEFVSSGEVVDTTVLNCLVASLLKARDLNTAQEIYSRMMRDHANNIAKAATEHPKAVLLPSTSTDFAVRRSRSQNLCALFEAYLERKKTQGEKPLPELHIPIVPNIRTFAIFLRHHCLSTGDLTAVSQLLDDMEKIFESPPRVIIYYFLFCGFGTHSSTKGWTEKLLLGAWDAFKRVLYDSHRRMGDLDGLCLPSKSATRWENPLKSFQIYQPGSQTQSLELADEGGGAATDRVTADEGKRSGGKRSGDVADRTSQNDDLMALFDQFTQSGRPQEEWFPDENIRRRLDNGMFLGRELNIVILKAFGAHCDTKTLLGVYADIERMWRPGKRLAVDVNSVRKELQRQLQSSRTARKGINDFPPGYHMTTRLGPTCTTRRKDYPSTTVFQSSAFASSDTRESVRKAVRNAPHAKTYHADMVNDHKRLWVDIDFTLRRVFGKTSFRPLQREVISAVIDGHDVFLQAATSFGKSLCFQLPAVVSHGVTLVVSPLLSLMVDQVAALEAYGIPVATINGTTPLSERKLIIEDILSGHPKIRLLYVTPEFCCTETFRRNLKRIHAQGELNRVAIDEAHCISEWGHDFRPAYQELCWFRETFKEPLVPITALTATATPKIRNDIVRLLGLDKDSMKWFHTPSARPNIHYEVKYVEELDDVFTSADEERVNDILLWLDTVRKRRESRMNPDENGDSNDPKPKLPPISGIVYVPLRTLADELARILNKSGRNIRAVAYHAGLPAGDRKRIQKMWASKDPPPPQQTGPCPSFSIVVATNAFGMGIDNPHVRFVIHWAPPRSFEGLVQESGRAGRDGRAAISIIYYNRNERDRVLERVKNDSQTGRTSNRFAPQSANSKKRSLEARMESFNKVIAFCESTDRCRHEIIREFSGDLELETIMSSQTTRSNPTSTSPCDFACDVCKYGTAEITRKKTEMLKASAQLEAMGAYHNSDLHTFMYYWMTYFVRH